MPPVDQPVRPGHVPLQEAAQRLGYSGTPWRQAARAFPVRWPAAYLALAEGTDGEPIRRLGVPDAAELTADPGDLPDPVGEARRQPHPFVVSKHADRAILIVTSRCHFYCRFCFRRAFPGGSHRDPTAADLEGAIAWLAAQPDLREVILSGGDPLVLPDARLEDLAVRLSRAPGIRTLRIHTRAPVHQPERVTPELVAALLAGPPPWMVVHFDHAAEIQDGPRRALRLLQESGMPVLNQTVLLRGVNDSPDALAALFGRLAGLGVRPYYLHHPDRAPGTARFRVGLARGLEIFDGLRRLVRPEALPAYVIDLPDGSGKVPVACLERLGGSRWRAPSGYELEEVD